MIKIEMDNISGKFHKNELSLIQDDVGGIYFLYNLVGDLIYIGRTINFKKRLHSHFSGKTNTSYFHKKISFFRVFYTNNRVEQKIYELYAINAMKPKYNKADVYEEEEETVNVKSYEEIEKDRLISFIVKLMSKNKSVTVGISAMKAICENNRLINVSLFDEYVLLKLKENNVYIDGREFIYKKNNQLKTVV